MAGNPSVGLEPKVRIIRFAVSIWLFLILLNVVGSFLYLGASSLWLDELFTVYLADSSLADFKSFLARASEDVHPPGYYTLVWAAGRLTGGDMAIVARGVSAAAAALSLIALYFAMPKWVSRPARIYGCTLAATSAIYFGLAQEARSYTYSWLLTAALLALVFAVVHAAADEKPLSRRLLAFAALGIVAGLSHAYLIPLAGAMVAMMLCFGRNWANRIQIALAGIAILVANLAYIRWHADKIVSDVAKHWFRSDFDFLWRHTRSGINNVHGSAPEEILSIILIALGAFAAAWMWSKNRAPEIRGRYMVDVALVLGSGVTGIALVILITLLYTPSYSARFFLVLAPLYWMLSALLFEAVLRSSWRLPIIALTVLATVTFSTLTIRVAWRDVPRKQPWRETAEFVESLPGCENATLPVVTFTQDYIAGSEPAAFYGYYMQNGAARDWLSYPRDEVKSYPGTTAAKELVARRIDGSDPCPLLLWRVHHSGPSALEIARSAMLDNYTLSEGTSIVLETFKAPEHNWFMRFLNVSPQDAGHLLIVQR